MKFTFMRNSLPLIFLTFLSTLSAQRFVGDISKFKLKDLENFSFSVDSIIDVRSHKDIVGYVHHGKPFLYRTAELEQSLPDLLNNHLTSGNPSKENLVITINRLFVYSNLDPNLRPVLHMELNLGFFKKSKNGYTEVFQAVSNISDRNGKPKKFLRKGLEESVLNCFQDYEARKASGKLLNRATSIEEIGNSNFHLNQPWGIDSALVLPKCLYKTYYDLRDNTPDTRTGFKTSYNGLKGYYPQGDNGKEIDDVYAFYEGTTLYIKKGNNFQKGRFSHGKVITEHYFDPKEVSSYNNGMATSAALGGLIGSIIYSSTNDLPESKGLMHMNFYRRHSDHPDFVDFDKITGEVLIYGSSFLTDGDTLNLTINGELMAKLGRDQYYLFPTNYTDQEVEICLTDGSAKNCEVVNPEIFQTTMLKGILKRNGSLAIDQLHWTEKSEIREAIKSGKARQVSN